MAKAAFVRCLLLHFAAAMFYIKMSLLLLIKFSLKRTSQEEISEKSLWAGREPTDAMGLTQISPRGLHTKRKVIISK